MNGGPQFISVPGHRIAVSGPFGNSERPNVVFLHGITGSVDFWDIVIPDKRKPTWRWGSVSLPCHAPSIANDKAPDCEIAVANCLADAIEALFPGESVHLVGWSTGGFSALLIAAEHPNLVKSVCSISGFARGKWGNTLGLMQQIARFGFVGRWCFRSLMGQLAASSKLYRKVLAMLTSSNHRGKTRANLEILHQGFAQHDFALLATFFAKIRSFDSTKSLSKITAPCLLIGGEKDTVIPSKEFSHLTSNLPLAKPIEIKDCGHLFYCEAPDTVWPQVNDWILRHEGA